MSFFLKFPNRKTRSTFCTSSLGSPGGVTRSWKCWWTVTASERLWRKSFGCWKSKLTSSPWTHPKGSALLMMVQSQAFLKSGRAAGFVRIKCGFEEYVHDTQYIYHNISLPVTFQKGYEHNLKIKLQQWTV